MADEQMASAAGSVPPPPPGFSPVQQDAAPAASSVPPPPPGFKPVQNPDTAPPAAPARTGNTGIAGVLSGIGGGIFDTAQGAKELVNKVLPSSVQIPDIPAELRTESTPSEHVGGFLESLGEFATGDELLEGATKLAKLEKLAKGSEWLTKALDNTPGLIKKIVGSTVKSGTVGAAQGAVKGAAEGDATGGAEGGAIGGAIGGSLGEAAGAVAKPVAEKMGIATTDEQDAMRAFRPNKREYNFAQNWANAKDRIIKEIGEDGKFKNYQDAADRLREVRQNLWNDEVKPEIDARAKNLFDTTPVADKITSKISDQMREHAPQEAKVMEDFAKKFENGRTVGDAEKDLEYFNAELEKQGYWKKTPKERAALEKVDGTVASRAAAVDALRDALYDHLEADGAPGIKDLKKQYGAISALENNARGQVNVEGRQRPFSLKQMVGIGAGIAHGGPMGAVTGIAVPLLDKIYNDPIALLNRAAAKAAPDSAVKSAVKDLAYKVKPLTDNALPAAATPTGRRELEGAAGMSSFRTGSSPVAEGPAADEWMKVTDGQGHEWQVHPADFDEMRRRDPNVKPV